MLSSAVWSFSADERDRILGELDEVSGWDADAWADAMDDYFDAYDDIYTDAEARSPKLVQYEICGSILVYGKYSRPLLILRTTSTGVFGRRWILLLPMMPVTQF